MFDTAKPNIQKAVLVHLNLGQTQSNLDEFKELVRAAGASCEGLIVGNRTKPDAKFFAGTGKVEEIKSLVKATEADIVIFDHELTPSQERNLEKEFSTRVISRTGLILDIFAQRARTFEGKLQVELAQLQHVSTRLIRGFTDYDSQKGGIGLRGPGETQLETDRRLLKLKILAIEEKLEKVQKQRATLRRAREKASTPQVALVGYTNAGKSTLFNQLTKSDVLVADMLFATLDPTVRMIQLPVVNKVMMADTVGFVSNLPHKLIASFRATLEETTFSDLLLHVIDVSAPNFEEIIAEVNLVLTEIEAMDIPQLLVFNKIDKLGIQPKIEGDKVYISALDEAGLELLKEAMIAKLSQSVIKGCLKLNPSQGKIQAQLYQLGAIVEESYDDEGNIFCQVQLPKEKWLQLITQTPSLDEQFTQK